MLGQYILNHIFRLHIYIYIANRSSIKLAIRSVSSVWYFSTRLQRFQGTHSTCHGGLPTADSMAGDGYTLTLSKREKLWVNRKIWIKV